MSISSSSHRRPDIQGLRAVAVLAVLVYHLDKSWLPGGFVGVDIFFVISGLLITQVLLRSVAEHGRPQLLKFWVRRAKRLLPNGALVLLAALVGSYFLLPAYRLQGVAQDVQAAATFLANFHFEQRAVDYFHLGDPPSPVLHFWSLAVEEQFYLLFPFLVAATAWGLGSGRIKGAMAVAALAIIVFSFAASLLVLADSQPKAFYQPQYRAWQLAVGSLIACIYDQRLRLPRVVAQSLVWAGSMGIGASLVLIGDDVIYPGGWALLPTISTGALLFALDRASDHPVTKLLGSWPAVKIGDLSYSLYLWHWPVIVFSAAHFAPSTMTNIGNAGLSLLLAYLAFVAFERPIHHAKISRGHFGIPFIAAVTCVLIVWSSAAAFSLIPSRTPPEIRDKIIAATNDLGENYAVGCHLDFDVTVQPACIFGSVESARRVVLFGDSHAAQWFTPLESAASQSGWRLETRTKTSCPPIDVTIWYRPTKSTYDACNVWRQAVLNDLIANPPEVIVVASSSRYNDWIFDPEKSWPADLATAKDLWMNGASTVIHELEATGGSIIWVQDTPKMYTAYKDCLSTEAWDRCGRPRAAALEGLSVNSDILARARVLDLTAELCSEAVCQAAAGREIMYRDEHHLTASYARNYTAQFLSILQSPTAPLSTLSAVSRPH